MLAKPSRKRLTIKKNKAMRVTEKQLLAIMPLAKNRVDNYIDIINGWCEEFGIDTPLRMAHFLAQIAHESAELRYTKELASGRAYEGRKDLGNVNPGDGVKYKGRGLIQITGRANYQKYASFCGFDVVGTPELLERPLGAVKSAMWFWQTHGLNELADQDDVVKITRVINGGTKGLADRKKYLERAFKAFGLLHLAKKGGMK